jgi:hypothetical protein
MTRIREFLSRVGRRVIAIVALVGIVVVSMSFDSQVEPVEPPSPQLESAIAAAPEEALSSAWFCPMVFSSEDEPENGEVAVTNLNESAVNARVEIFPTDGPSVETQLNVAGNSRSTLRPGEVVDSGFAAVSLEIDGGAVIAEHGVRSDSGESWSPCSSESSQTWHTADGSTDGGELRLGLFNPFDDYVVADIAATTDTGRSEPIEYIGVVVPANSVVVMNLNDQLRRREWVATSVQARRGRLVVSQLQTGEFRDASGLSLSMASPSTSMEWTLPDGAIDSGLTDTVSLYNPGETESELEIEVRVEGQEPRYLPAFVAPRGRSTTELFLEDDLPEGERLLVRVRSLNDVGVVVQRTMTAVEPASYRGYTIALGARSSHTQWVLGSTGISDNRQERIWISNSTDAPTRVELRFIGDGEVAPGRELEIGPYDRVGVNLNDVRGAGDKSVLVTSDAPVVVSSELRNDPPPGYSASPAIPLR